MAQRLPDGELRKTLAVLLRPGDVIVHQGKERTVTEIKVDRGEMRAAYSVYMEDLKKPLVVRPSERVEIKSYKK